MRLILLALLTSLWMTSTGAFARNGETGILIVIRRFEVQTDMGQNRVFVICREDWDHLQELLDKGLGARIYLQGYGVYDVEADGTGKLRIHQIETSKDQTFSLMSHACPVNSDTESQDSDPSC
jgi:hypothetical protein